jgi:ribose transport system permease protein
MMLARIRHLGRSPLAVVVVLFVVLLAINLALTPEMLSPSRLPGISNLLVPSVLAAMASVPSILSGRGGLDLSVGPLIGFTNVLLVGVLLPAGLGAGVVSLPLCILVGTLFGALSGFVVAYVRLQPIVVTLGGYLLLAGLALVVMPRPTSGAPVWTADLSGGLLGGLLPLSTTLAVIGVLVWIGAKQLGLVGLISAVGSDDRAAFTAGVDVGLVRVGAYALGGFFASLGGIALTVLINSGEPTAGIQYTLMAIVAVALGGNALNGGRGGMRGPILAAACLYLIQSLLSSFKVSSLWIQVVYGAILLVAIVINASISERIANRPKGSS